MILTVRIEKNVEKRLEKVVCNASPIICLFKADLQSLLPRLFGKIMIFHEVFAEVTESPRHPFPADDLLNLPGVEVIASVPAPEAILEWDLAKVNRRCSLLHCRRRNSGPLLTIDKSAVAPTRWVSNILAQLGSFSWQDAEGCCIP